jgi:hypothetical protein
MCHEKFFQMLFKPFALKNPFIYHQIRCKTIRDNAPVVTKQVSPLLGRITSEEVESNLSADLPFRISRKKSGFLPVYRQYKNGRTRSVTVIRNVEGNAGAFPENRMRLKASKSIQIEGNYVETVREWLTLHKF